MYWLTDNWHSLFPHPWGSVFLTLLALLCGAGVGIERQQKEKPAGIRTMALIALGSSTFTMVGYAFTSNTGDSGRVAAQIVTGVGFLGAGVLLRGTTSVHGVTTAATIWLVAAMGMAIGAGQAGAGIGLALLARIVLNVVNRWEFSRMAGASKSILRLVVDPARGKTEVKLESLLEQFEIPPKAVERSPTADERELWVVRLLLPRRSYHELLMTLVEQPEIYSIERQDGDMTELKTAR
jgi:putative Mg2+ transporter-C (MgtC) family protein